MLIAAALFFVASVYTGYYRSKNIMLAQISPVHTPFCWMRGRNHPWQWITLLFQFVTIAVSLVLVYSALESEVANLFVLVAILAGIFIARFLLSTFLSRQYIMKNHKQSAEAFLKMEKMKNMFKG